MALMYFFRSNVDVGIIEVGMGGRLDATNVISPMVSVITNIGLEHQEFLGHRIHDIAREKGGIIKQGIDVVTAVNQPPVIRLFSSLCQEKGAPLWRLGNDAHYRRLPSGLLGYYGLRDRYRDLELGLEGRFQYRNAALALLTLEVLREKGLSVSGEAIRSGLADVMWPGRLEKVSSDPTMILDGAHNPAAMRSLAYSVRKDFDFEQLILVLGIMKDKDIVDILRAILPLADRVIYTRPDYYRAANPQCLMDMAREFAKAGEIHPSVPEAIARARDLASKRDLILITGSLFTVGEAKACLDPLGYPAEHI